jgi:hypothetical protein
MRSEKLPLTRLERVSFKLFTKTRRNTCNAGKKGRQYRLNRAERHTCCVREDVEAGRRDVLFECLHLAVRRWPALVQARDLAELHGSQDTLLRSSAQLAIAHKRSLGDAAAGGRGPCDRCGKAFLTE